MTATFNKGKHLSEQSAAEVYIIAEIGVNHDGNVDKAVNLVNTAAAAGADAVKLQYFKAEHLLSNQSRLAAYQKSGENDPHSMLKRLELDIDEMLDVQDETVAEEIDFILTPFSLEDFQDLKTIDPDCIKIASPDCVNLPLIKTYAALEKPLIVSTGTATLDEIRPAAEFIKNHPQSGALLQCVSSYPTPEEEAALSGISLLHDTFGLPAGYSDHTPETITGAMAVSAGACVLEKHLTYNQDAEGPDHKASLDPIHFSYYVELARKAALMMGPRIKDLKKIEGDVHHVSRQSVCAAEDLTGGTILQASHLTIRRPGEGIPAASLPEVAGKKILINKRKGDLIYPDEIE